MNINQRIMHLTIVTSLTVAIAIFLVTLATNSPQLGLLGSMMFLLGIFCGILIP